jgi:hypothetical protein
VKSARAKTGRGFDLISDALPFGRLWYDTPEHAIGYAMHDSRSHEAGNRVYHEAGNVIGTHEHAGESKNGENPRQSTEIVACVRTRWTFRATDTV